MHHVLVELETRRLVVSRRPLFFRPDIDAALKDTDAAP